jgi:TetR/AcrR family transcriptional regulator
VQKPSGQAKKRGARVSVSGRVRRPDEVRARVLSAALEAFADSGFSGASTRDIAKRARVSISLLVYHFRSKEGLWRAVFDDLFSKGAAEAVVRDEHLEKASASEQLRVLIEHTVQLFALNPALHRLMTHEGHRLSDRLEWICDTYTKKDFQDTCNLIRAGQAEGKVRKEDPERLRFAIIALAAVPFSVSAEYQYLTKRNPFSPSEIRNAIDFIERLVFR